jgi:hypothetical protein
MLDHRPLSEVDRKSYAQSKVYRSCRVARRNFTPGRSQNRA